MFPFIFIMPMGVISWPILLICRATSKQGAFWGPQQYLTILFILLKTSITEAGIGTFWESKRSTYLENYAQTVLLASLYMPVWFVGWSGSTILQIQDGAHCHVRFLPCSAYAYGNGIKILTACLSVRHRHSKKWKNLILICWCIMRGRS